MQSAGEPQPQRGSQVAYGERARNSGLAANTGKSKYAEPDRGGSIIKLW
jgi:hypothetical protein